MSPYQYALQKKEYIGCNVAFWGLFRGHCIKAREGSLGHKVIHVLIAAAEVIPVISQIASLFEYLIVKWSFKESSQSSPSGTNNPVTPPNLFRRVHRVESRPDNAHVPSPGGAGLESATVPLHRLRSLLHLTEATANVAGQIGLVGDSPEGASSGELLARTQAHDLAIQSTVVVLEQKLLQFLGVDGLDAATIRTFTATEIRNWVTTLIKGDLGGEDGVFAELLAQLEDDSQDGALVTSKTYNWEAIQSFLRGVVKRIASAPGFMTPPRRNSRLEEGASGAGEQTIQEQLGMSKGPSQLDALLGLGAPKKGPVVARNQPNFISSFGLTCFDGLPTSCPTTLYEVPKNLLPRETSFPLYLCDNSALVNLDLSSSISIITGEDEATRRWLDGIGRASERYPIIPDIFENVRLEGLKHGPWVDRRFDSAGLHEGVRPWWEKEESFQRFFKNMDARLQEDGAPAYYLLLDGKKAQNKSDMQKTMNPRIMLMMYFIDVALRKDEIIDISKMINAARQLTGDLMPITGALEAVLQDYLKFRRKGAAFGVGLSSTSGTPARNFRAGAASAARPLHRATPSGLGSSATRSPTPATPAASVASVASFAGSSAPRPPASHTKGSGPASVASTSKRWR